MKFRLSSILSVVFNSVLLVFFASSYFLMKSKVSAVLQDYDHTAHQQSVDLIARSIRHSAAIGDFVGMRRAFQNALNDRSVERIRFRPADGSEGVCVGRERSCYEPGNSSRPVSSKLHFDGEKTQPIGEVLLDFVGVGARDLGRVILTYVGMAFVFSMLLFNIVFWIFNRRIRDVFSWNVEAVRRLSLGSDVNLEPSNLAEKEDFASALASLQSVLSEYRSSVELVSRQKAFIDMAKQVAHDIRSPLTALAMVADEMTALPERTRVLTLSAVSSIQNIANGLLNFERLANTETRCTNPFISTGEPITLQMIPSLLELVVASKRMQFKQKEDVFLELNKGSFEYGLFSPIQPLEFKRLVSNLIDNAVQSFSPHGSVVISIHETNSLLELSFQDNGRGIPSHILPQLANRGFSYGKPGGNGLGLFHAKSVVESWGGSLEIDSTEGFGTTVKLLLRKAIAPKWYTSEIELPADGTLAIVDDEQLIHEVWDRRLRDLGNGKSSSLEVVHFFGPADLFRWCTKNLRDEKKLLFLVDYEFLGEETNGLELISRCNILEKSLLVTNRYDDPDILTACERSGVRMIPKGMADLVPIFIKTSDIPPVNSLA